MTVLYIFYVIFQLIFNTTGMSHLKITSFMFRPLYLRGKRHRHQFDRRLCEYQNRSQRFGEEKSLLAKAEIEPGFIGRPVHSIITTSTELSVLRRADAHVQFHVL
jgi:hypothetical protein